MAEANPDSAPKMEVKKPVTDGSDIPEKDWKFYFFPENITIVLSRNFWKFSALVGVYYCIQFVCCCGSTNFYSSTARLNTCTLDGV